jgi:hypothetical protein
MAQLHFPVTRAGLAVPVWIGLTSQTTAPLVAAGGPVPAPVRARGLLDTCTDVTAVAPWILQQLAVPVITTTSTHTAGGPVKVQLYRISLGITDPTQPSGAPWLTEPDLLVTGLAAALPDTDVLVGLDVLLGYRLMLEGPARRFWLEV